MEQVKIMHTLRLERNILTVTGVTGVDEYDNKEMKIRLSEGGLTVKGSGLDLSDFNVSEQKLVATGEISDISYSRQGEKVPLIKRLLK